MNLHRPPGPRARSAHAVRALHSLRAAYSAHQARSRERRTPPAPRKLQAQALDSIDLPTWSAEAIPLDGLPWEESACLDSIDRIGRPVTAADLSLLSANVLRLDNQLRNEALDALVDREILERRSVRGFIVYGFPEHFEEIEEGGDVVS